MKGARQRTERSNYKS